MACPAALSLSSASSSVVDAVAREPAGQAACEDDLDKVRVVDFWRTVYSAIWLHPGSVTSQFQIVGCLRLKTKTEQAFGEWSVRIGQG